MKQACHVIYTLFEPFYRHHCVCSTEETFFQDIPVIVIGQLAV